MGRAISYHALLKLLLPEDWRQANVFQVGLEREMLRLDGAELAQTPHPAGWGSPLTHPTITLDFSAAQPELVSPPQQSLSELLDYMQDLHAYVARQLPENELLWFPSMPPALHDAQIQIADFGPSHTGQFKTIYRQGLAHRYGKKMQVISGIHFNFSWQQSFWQRLHERVGDSRSLGVFSSENYLALMRNYLRLSWLLAYLIGASPAVDRSFVKRQTSELSALKEQTLFGPYATSLRMSRIGYVNSSRCNAHVSYNSVTDYLSSLYQAISTECPGFSLIETRGSDGSWRQLNTHLLQIENEHYALIRPKQVPLPGERPFQAVRSRGVSYVEVRAIDNQPDTPIGVHGYQLDFVRLFLLYCLLYPNPPLDREQEQENNFNHQQAALLGRQPDLLLRRQGEEIRLQDWGLSVLAEMQPLAELMDQHSQTQTFGDALARMEGLLRDASLTPSARALEALQQADQEYLEWGMERSAEHQSDLRQHPLSGLREAEFQAQTQQSLQQQAEMEAQNTGDFESYLKHYTRLKPDGLLQEAD
ncbi:MAG: glutamate--cysteine ligase [Candidatus Sericytochromatia bacterium]|nr:glutamate--cysteine ligase [Candidatus Sericytochromatia bacterium]